MRGVIGGEGDSVLHEGKFWEHPLLKRQCTKGTAS